MGNIKIREFKGLKTYIDPADIDNGYFNTFENLRPRIGYAEAVHLAAEEEQGQIYIPPGQKLILVDFVYLDEDKNKNTWNQDTKELLYDYQQKLEKYTFWITYSSVDKRYIIFIRKTVGGTGSIIAGYHDSYDSEQYPYVINEKGICKILFKEKSYLLAKYDRYYWTYDSETPAHLPVLTQGGPQTEPFILYPLVKDLSKDASDALFTFAIETSQTPTTSINIYRNNTLTTYYFPHPNGNEYNCKAISFKDEDGRDVPFSNSSTYLLLLKCTVYDAFGDELGRPFAFWLGHDELQPHPASNIKYFLAARDRTRWQVRIGGEDTSIVDGDFGYPKGWAFLDEADVNAWLGNPPAPPAEQLTYDLLNVALENYFDSTEETEIITTVVIRDNEFPINFTSLKQAASKYVISVTPNAGAIENIYPEKTAAKIYIRNRTTLNEISNRDFELCHTLTFTSGKQGYHIKYIDSLTPNGIFLTQTIGKAIDPNTYKIETAYDDYINVNGVPFILKNGNVLYPAVGNGMVHTDMFFPENYVPQVSGKFLTILENKLAVFEENKEEMTYVDFQDVEGQLIFFVRGSATYRIKNYWDLIETAEGIIINLSDGIYVTNGESRSLISLPINDIVKKYYDSSSIYYNSYEKELLFICSNGIYLYRFETTSWSKMDFTGVDIDLTSDNVIDIIDDYEGTMYLVLVNGKVYKIGYQNAIGKFGLTNVDLQELSVAKRLNWIAVDAAGKVNGKETTKTGNRNVLFFNTMLKDRRPNQWINFEFTIDQIIVDGEDKTGIIYNLEINLEAFSIRKI